jgi:hypothetical protein
MVWIGSEVGLAGSTLHMIDARRPEMFEGAAACIRAFSILSKRRTEVYFVRASPVSTLDVTADICERHGTDFS